MGQLKKWWPMIGIVLLAAGLRFYKLGIIPLGYTWDETAIIYNAWGIALWHRDEYANLMPLAFKSFGDYKAPLLVYALAIPYKLFGLSEVLIRVYSALAGVVTVVVTYFLVYEFVPKEFKKYSRLMAVVGSGLLAVSPWHLQFSRVGFEPNLALLFTTLGFLFLVKGEKDWRWWWGAAFSFALSLYSYQNTKIFVPLMALVYVLIKQRILFKKLKQLLLPVGFFVLLSLPLVYSTIYSGAGARGKQTLIFYDEQSNIRQVSLIVKEFVANARNQLSPAFWVDGYDAVSLRHLVPNYGAIYKIEAVFLIVGLGWLLFKIRRANNQLLIAWFLIGLLPAILAHHTPHAIRSLLTLPSVQIITAIGLITTVLWVKTKSDWGYRLLVSFSVVALVVNLGFYLREYYGDYAIKSATEFKYGYKQAVQIAQRLGKTRDTIFFTDKYGQAYIYILLHQRTTPEHFLAGGLANYFIAPISWPPGKPDSVYVGMPEEIPPDDPLVVDIIKVPKSDEIVFVIAETGEKGK